MSLALDKLIREMSSQAPQQLDLTSSDHLDLARDFADRILAVSADPGDLARLEVDLVRDKDATPLLVHLVVKMALSRSLVLQLARPAHLSVVFAVYKEHQRILPAAEVAGGEDFLRRKAGQLDWLTAGCPGVTWDMIIVDDGCPEDSGGIARRIAAENGLDDRVRVLFLAEALDAGHPLSARLESTADSMKGGAIQLGMGAAAEQKRENHVIAFTDADLSTHLGQTGLLLDGILRRGFDAAIGSRREPASVVIKKGSRNDRGKLFIYLWKRIISCLPDIVDTQCGFKAFSADSVRAIVPDMIEQKFAFDIELLIRTQLRRAGSILKVPVAWIDSDALSTTTDLQPYLPMLRKMVQMYRVYLPASPAADRFAAFIDSLDEEAWERLQENIPAAITGREPAEFGRFDGVTAAELTRCARPD